MPIAEVLSTSPGSTDLSDPEEIRRKIIEILCDPDEHTEEIKQLQKLVKLRSKYSKWFCSYLDCTLATGKYFLGCLLSG